VPNAPRAVVGAINFRGNVLSAMDLAEILVPSSTTVKKDRTSLATDEDVLILESADQMFAIFVDEIREIVVMTEDDLRHTLASFTGAKSDYFFQGVMLDQSGHIILVLNVDYLLQVITNPVILEQDSTQAILFDTPTHEVVSKTEVARQVALGDNALVLITLLGDKYALISASVVQILQTLTITPVATNVRYFVGSTTFRGEVVPIIDLQSFFYGGQLAVTSRTLDEQKSYIALDHADKTVIFQVETVLGSIEMPDESEVTGLVNFANPEENPYYDKAFIYDAQIIVLLEHSQILERVISELEQSQTRFIEENQVLLTPIRVPEASEEYNIDLQQKLSAQAPITSVFDVRKAISSDQRVTRTATLVSVQDMDILVPNNSIVEIYNVSNITKVPNAPRAVVGVIDFRGNILSAIDLAEILVPTYIDIRKKKINRKTNVDVLILESVDQQFAIYVDEIREIVEMTEDDLRLILTSFAGVKSDYYFQGVMLDQSGHIILVLNVDYLLQVITNPVILEQDSTQTILFDTPTHEVVSKTEVARQVTFGDNALILITLLGDKYALISASVVQILQTLTITPVATNVRYFVGSTTFRGEIVPVIDLQSFFYDGQLNIAARTPEVQKSYIALDHAGKTVIFQVETILGSIEMPDESEVTDLVDFANLEENSYFNKAFPGDDEQIIVLLEHGQIFERIISELEKSQTRFIEENQVLLVPNEVPEASERYNIDLKKKFSTQAPTTLAVDVRKAISSDQKVTRTATLVSVQGLDILVPNNDITQIFNVQKISKVPNAPRAVVGAFEFHNKVLSAMDLAEILVPSSIADKKDRTSLATDEDVLILESADQQFAIFVDEIREIVEMTDDDFRPIIAFSSETDFSYYFQGVMLDRSGHIILVLNVDYLFHVVSNPDVLEEDNTQIAYFKNPIEESTYQVTESLKEGFLFEDDGHLFSLDSEYVVQVIEQNAFQFKKYSHDAIIGAAIHNNIVPLIDFNIILQGKRDKPIKSKKSVGLLIYDPKSNLEVVLLVDSVMNKVPIESFGAFQTKLGISTKLLSPIISGFFSYRDALGMIMSPVYLFKEIFSVLQEILPLKDIKEEFSSTLLPEEIEFLEVIRTRRKELELLLFYHHEGIRFEFFVFKWRENLFSIDIFFARRVFASLKIQNIDPQYHPIIGIATEDQIPIIDLAAVILATEKQTEFTKSNYFFLIEHQSQNFFVPVDGIEGVVTKFKEELVPCEDASIFFEGKETCQYTFSHENVSSPIYIIENEYVVKMLTKKDLETQLKKLRKKKILKKKD
jgi:purine-binding chemotaxis protein CheW